MIVRTTNDLAHLIRDQRSRRSLTQARLAELAGVSRKWIVDLEAGKPTRDLSLVLRTIKALGLTLEVREPNKDEQRDDVEVDDVITRSTDASGRSG